MRYLLDTDTVSFILRGEGRVERRLRSSRPSEIATSPIVVGEIELGLRRRGSRNPRRLTERLFEVLTVILYDAAAGRRYGALAAVLLAKGEPIGIEDTMVAAQALELDLTLVTHNVRHFEHIPSLEIEDWY
jgi:tRNA(fMet)-specific endonuclease VapC